MKKIFDRVKSKGSLLGKKITGSVYGILAPGCLNFTNQKLEKWNRLFPEWRNQFLYCIKLDEPSKPCALEDAKGDLEAYNALPLNDFLTFPEQEIEYES